MREIGVPARTARRMAAWRRRIVALLRVLWGCLCACDACYRLFVVQGQGTNQLVGSARIDSIHSPFAPGWPAPWLYFAHFEHPYLLTTGVAVVELLIAGCLLCGALTNVACLLGGMLTVLGCTATGALAAFTGPELFDPGIILVSLLTFVGLGLGNAGGAYGLDRSLASKLGRWSFLASAADTSAAPRRAVRTGPLQTIPVLTSIEVQARSAEPEMHSVDDTQNAHISHNAYVSKNRQRVLFM
ncbi:MAG: hypothetical protein NVSMB44_12900 [Ktedonobacteraceae bacterium]